MRKRLMLRYQDFENIRLIDKKVLVICNTPFQILTTLWLRYINYLGSDTDLIVSDHMNKSYDIYERIKKENIFKSCFYVTSYNYSRQIKPEFDGRTKYTRLFPTKRFRKYVNIKKKYNYLLAANPDDFTILAFNSLNRITHGKIRFLLMEDGLGTYSDSILNALQYSEFDTPTAISKIAKIVLREHSLLERLEGALLFDPTFLSWNINRVLKIPKIINADELFVSIINRVFDYHSPHCIKQKYILFEDGYVGEGWPIDDFNTIKNIVNNLGKENVIIKRHPRVTDNRFSKDGFSVMEQSSIPWEVVCLNLTKEEIEQHIYLTMLSTAALNMVLIFDLDIHILSFYELLSDYSKDCFKKNTVLLCRNICEKTEKYKFIKNLEEINI